MPITIDSVNAADLLMSLIEWHADLYYIELVSLAGLKFTVIKMTGIDFPAEPTTRQLMPNPVQKNNS